MKYTSLYNPDTKINPSQYIAELICQNKAAYLKLELPSQFWNIMPEWLGYYQIQLSQAKILLEKYSFETLVRVIKERNIFSLKAKWIEPYFIKQEMLNNKPVEDTDYHRILDSMGLLNKNKKVDILDE